MIYTRLSDAYVDAYHDNLQFPPCFIYATKDIIGVFTYRITVALGLFRLVKNAFEQ